jgi:N-acetylglutamate synthase-like GNAT family acetyltransferase
MQIRAAAPGEAQALTELVMVAKAHWGYEAAQLEAWRSSLAVTQAQLSSQPAFVAEDGEVVGFYSLRLQDGRCEMDNLWVVPRRMGRGYGRSLVAHATAVAKALAFESIVIDADPNAEGFYVRCGAVVTGRVPAPIPGQPCRARPQLMLSTAQPHPAMHPTRAVG